MEKKGILKLHSYFGKKWPASCGLILALSFCSISVADEYFIVKRVAEKSSQKKSVSWTLADWMQQKSEFRFWDNWLSMNRATHVFEGYLGGFHGSSEVESESLPSQKIKLTGGDLGLYLSILGIEGEYSDTDASSSSWLAHFLLRIFGSARQGSHLDFFYGQKSFSAGSDWKQNYWGGRITLYLLENFAFAGLYRTYLDPTEPLSLEVEYEQRASLIIDMSFIQLYGDFYTEGFSQNQTNKGWLGGLRLFF